MKKVGVGPVSAVPNEEEARLNNLPTGTSKKELQQAVAAEQAQAYFHTQESRRDSSIRRSQIFTLDIASDIGCPSRRVIVRLSVL